MPTHTAHCSCGQLSITCEGAPSRVSVCHCDGCRKRTGSAFGVAVFFLRTQVKVQGASTVYIRVADSGTQSPFHFCAVCGGTVFWEPAFKPDAIGVSHGAFDKPGVFRPEQTVYDDERYDWITLSDDFSRMA